MDPLKAPIEHATGSSYKLLHRFNQQDLTSTLGYYPPYRHTTIRAQTSADPVVQAVCPGEWTFQPLGDFDAFVQSLGAGVPGDSLPGLFYLRPNLLWNDWMEKKLFTTLPTIYVYWGLSLNAAWLQQIQAYLDATEAIVEGPAFYDYVRRNYTVGETPFADDLQVAGSHEWRASRWTLQYEGTLGILEKPEGKAVPVTREDKNSLLLIDRGLGKESGALRLKVLPGWEVRIRLTTGNDGYFAFLKEREGITVKDETTNLPVLPASSIEFTMGANDELQISTDPNEHPELAPYNFLLFLKSEKWTQPAVSNARFLVSHAAMNDQCHVDLLGVRRIDEKFLDPSDPNPDPSSIPMLVYEGDIQKVKLVQSSIPPGRRKLREFLRGGLSIPTSVTSLLPKLAANAGQERELTIQCGLILSNEQLRRGFSPLGIDPMPFESVYQRFNDLGESALMQDSGNHPVIKLFTDPAIPRQAAVRCAEVEYLSEWGSGYVDGGPRFDAVYPGGAISDQWSAWVDWLNPKDGGWRRTPISYGGRFYVDTVPQNDTLIRIYKDAAPCRISIQRGPKDLVDLAGMDTWTEEGKIRLPYNDYLCGIALQGQPMMIDFELIRRWTLGHLLHFNENNILRAGFLAYYYERHPEIAWALVEHLVSRNRGYLIMNVYRWEQAKTAIFKLKDIIMFCVALWEAALVPEPLEPVILALAVLMTSLLFFTLESVLDGEHPMLNSDNLADEISVATLLGGGLKNLKVNLLSLVLDQVEHIVDYVFISYQRIFETMDYVTLRNAIPQLSAYRWAKAIELRNGIDTSQALFDSLFVSEFSKNAWLGFYKDARKTAGPSGNAFWQGKKREEIAADPVVIRHAIRMWIDQHELLEQEICGSAAAGHNGVIGYYIGPTHYFTRGVVFASCHWYKVPLQTGSTIKELRFHPTKQTVEELITDYLAWFTDPGFPAILRVPLTKLLDPNALGALSLARLRARLRDVTATPSGDVAHERQKILKEFIEERRLIQSGGGDSVWTTWQKIVGDLQDIMGGNLSFPPAPDVRDGFGNLDRRVEMMIELLQGLLRSGPETGGGTRLTALWTWIDAHRAHGSDLAQKLQSDATPTRFRDLTGVARRFRLNRIEPRDWYASIAGDSTALKKLQSLIDRHVKPAAQSPLQGVGDPFL